ncbi:MAG: hypothetical protein ABSH35_22120 [Isosphaeraceae bacterium]|jgi:hypothetical protein
MKTKHKFTPGQVVPLEERALLSGFRFPAVVGSVHILPGQRGALVLTSLAYANVQATANTAIVSFEKAVITEAKKDGWGTVNFNAVAFDTRVGTDLNGGGGAGANIGGAGSPNFWSYPSRTLLAALDAKMGALEYKLPFGGGNNGAANPTLGAGLSNKTVIVTGSLNNSSFAVGSVAIAMDTQINNAAGGTLATLSQDLELGRGEALAFHITNAASPLNGGAGILPNYVIQFGSGSATPVFSLKNT